MPLGLCVKLHSIFPMQLDLEISCNSDTNTKIILVTW